MISTHTLNLGSPTPRRAGNSRTVKALRALRRRVAPLAIGLVAPVVVLGLLSMLAYGFLELFFDDGLFRD